MTNRISIARVLFPAFCLLLTACAVERSSRNVSVPFPALTSFHPAEWKAQHILSQGTLFEGLFGYESEALSLGEMKVVPLLAESWKNSPDGRVWIIRLHKGRKWSNGDPITAYDFEWSFKFYCGRAVPEVPLWASALGSISNAWNVRNGNASPDELGIRALNETTLRIVLDRPDYNLPFGLAAAAAVPVHRASVEAHPDSWASPEHLVCNGPFIVESFTQGHAAVLRRNPRWKGVRGNVETVVLNFERDQVAAYRAGRLDAAWIGTDRSPFPQGSVLRQETDSLSFNGYSLTRGHSPVLDDQRIRKAFALAVDREALVDEVLRDRAVPSWSVWPRKSSIGKKFKPRRFDPGQARRLLKDAGHPDGKSLSGLKWFVPPEGDPAAEFVVREWERHLGVKVEIVPLTADAFDAAVWRESPEAPAGFCSLKAGMNYFSPGSLTKAMEHTILFYAYPAAIRQAIWNFDTVLREKIRISTKGADRADWAALETQRDEEIRRTALTAEEPNRIWKNQLPSAENIRARFERFIKAWEEAPTPAEKKAVWRSAAESLLNDERDLFAYEHRSGRHREMTRTYQDLSFMSWEKALRSAHKVLRMFQEEYYIVPLYHEKIRYVHRMRVRGLMVYKLAWGPEFFNFRNLNVFP